MREIEKKRKKHLKGNEENIKIDNEMETIILWKHGLSISDNFHNSNKF